jgi:hypothetical protein
MANKHLRNWIKSVDATGELQVIKAQRPRKRIGGFIEARDVKPRASKELGARMRGE